MISKKNKIKECLYVESVFDFYQDFCQNGWDRALKIRTLLPKSERMVSLLMTEPRLGFAESADVVVSVEMFY